MIPRSSLSPLLQVLAVLLLLSSSGLASEELEEPEQAETHEFLAERPGCFEPEDLHSCGTGSERLFWAGELELASEYWTDLELEPSARDDLLQIEPAFIMTLFGPLGDWGSVFLETELHWDWEEKLQLDRREERSYLDRIETWLFLGRPEGGFGLQVGQQWFEDERKWWWDESLDSIRLRYDGAGFHAQAAVAQQVAARSSDARGIEPEEEDLLRLLGQLAWSPAEALRLDLFSQYQTDRSGGFLSGSPVDLEPEDPVDGDLFWLGARISGEVEVGELGTLSGWVDGAWLDGRERIYELEGGDDEDEIGGESPPVIQGTTRNVRGHGLDVGVTWQVEPLADLELTLGFARGSGDEDPEDGTDRAFRQTGLGDGGEGYQYYGEVLDPMLSNLEIWTFALGIPVAEEADVFLVYHRYDQVVPAQDLRETELEAEPLGLVSEIGQELDLVLAVESWNGLDIELKAGFFRAGDAFGGLTGETAGGLAFDLGYRF